MWGALGSLSCVASWNLSIMSTSWRKSLVKVSGRSELASRRGEEAAHDYNFVWRILSWTAGPAYKRADFQILTKSRDSWQLNQAVRKLEIFTCSVSVKCEALLKVAVVLWEVWRRCNKQNSGCLLLVTRNSDYKKYIWKVPASPSLFPVCYIQ